MGGSNIYKCANRLIKTYETNNPFKITEHLKIQIEYKKIGSLKGFYTCILRNKYIVLNEDMDDISAKIVCAHELGHDRFHRNLGINLFKDELCVSMKTYTPELEANYFAAELLIYDNDFLKLTTNGYTYEEIAKILEVHTELVLIKAQLLNGRGHKLNVPYLPSANFLNRV